MVQDSCASEEVKIRLFLVRHGETRSNIEKRVSGQAESPLTELGEKQAMALGRSGRLDKNFWKKYSSDLGRARATASLLMTNYTQDSSSTTDETNAQDSTDSQFQFDPRLRELSKGARQGFLKSLSEEEALALRKRECEMKGEVFRLEDVPSLESERDGFVRFSKWLFEVVQEAILENNNKKRNGGVKTETYLTLVVSHSALLRSVLMNFFSKEKLLEHDAVFDTPNHLVIPNTSLTIVEIVPDLEHRCWSDDTRVPVDYQRIWKAKLVELAWADHYSSIQ